MFTLEMTIDEFYLFRDFIYEKSGINYTENKKIILQNRVRRRLRELNINSYKTYFDMIRNKPMNNEEIIKFFDEVTTNETSFFRHERQFVALRSMVIPDIIKTKTGTDLNIWSAAASMGKEAYTLAMVLKNMPELQKYNINILGTDLNMSVLEMAMQGEYDLKDMKDIPAEYTKYINVDNSRGIMQIKPELKKVVNFRRFNLKDSFNSISKMDIILCRNVFIYFEKATQKNIVEKFYERLNNGGYFILGHSETLNGISDRFEYKKFNNENLMIYKK